MLSIPTAVTIEANVTSPALTPNSQVRVLLMNKAASTPYQVGTQAGTLPEIDLGTLTADLTRQGDGHFNGTFPGELTLTPNVQQVSADACMGDPCYVDRPLFQDVAVVIDGTWLKDPVSGQSNFQINMNQAAGISDN
jgi:hypothetical protein